MRTLKSTPLTDGYHMPAEFGPHHQSWMLWPERTDIWPHGGKPAQTVFAEIASAIAQFEAVTVGVSSRQYQNARARLPPSVRVVEVSYNGCWIRDTGPVFISNDRGHVRGVDWEFNAWGGLKEGLYFPWDLDNLIAQKILDLENIDRYAGPLIMEGGGINVDGEGTLLTTESCILNPNRNADIDISTAEQTFSDFLGVKKIIWLKRGLYLDETGGHIDNLCSFVRPGVVLLTWTTDSSDPQYEISQEAYELLASTTDAHGKPLKIIKIQQPQPIYIEQTDSASVDSIPGTVPRIVGARLPASYINFYFVNGGLLVPIFRDAADSGALRAISDAVPDKKIVPINTKALLFGGGNIHCNVLQQPLAKN